MDTMSMDTSLAAAAAAAAARLSWRHPVASGS